MEGLPKPPFFASAVFWLGLGSVVVLAGVGVLASVGTQPGTIWSRSAAPDALLALGLVLLLGVGVLTVAHQHIRQHLRTVTVRPGPSAHRRSRTGAGAGPTTKTLFVLRQIRMELIVAHQRIQESRASGTPWPRLEASTLRVTLWELHRAEVAATPGLGRLPERLEAAYGRIDRINGIARSRVFAWHRVGDKDDLTAAATATGHALAVLNEQIHWLERTLLKT
jgi:hypothetical protein